MSTPTPERPPSPPPDDTPTGQISLVTTTVNTPRPGVGRHAAPASVAERGSLSIADTVVEKVAAAAAGEVDHVGGAARRVLGVPTGREGGDGPPRGSATVNGQLATLEVRMSVVYPASVRAVTEATRAHLRDRVEALTELTVSRVDISVAALTGADTGGDGKRVIA